MKPVDFTVRVIDEPPHKKGTQIWRAAMIVQGMADCEIGSIIQALTAKERDTSPAGIGKPARWLTHFAGLESEAAGKALTPWIEIVYKGDVIRDKKDYWALLKERGIK